MLKKTLFLFTAEFPYGKGESFLENEIPVLINYFKEIYILPKKKPNTLTVRKFSSEKIKIIDPTSGVIELLSKEIFFRNFFFILKILITECYYCPKKYFFIKNIRLFNAMLIRSIADSNQIMNIIKEHAPENIVLYSFWMDDSALALAVLKEKKRIKKFIFRCGGFDIFDERHFGNYLPFRYFIYKNTAAIYPNSLMGELYIKGKKLFADKVKTQYWGTSDYGTNKLDEANTFHIVSCSRMVSLKRIHLIAEILSSLKFEATWTHIGDGELKDEIIKFSKNILPSNINVNFMGSLTNQEVITFYKNTPVNLFISTSETESLPVSIQEAISFGIPIVATDVGGVAEVVNDKTGFLVEKNFDPVEVARVIEKFKDSSKNSEAFRQGTRLFWLENFNAQKVYSSFSQLLLN